MSKRVTVSILLIFLSTHTLLGDEKSIAMVGCRDNFERLRTGACRIELIIDHRSANHSFCFVCFVLDPHEE